MTETCAQCGAMAFAVLSIPHRAGRALADMEFNVADLELAVGGCLAPGKIDDELFTVISFRLRDDNSISVAENIQNSTS